MIEMDLHNYHLGPLRVDDVLKFLLKEFLQQHNIYNLGHVLFVGKLAWVKG